MFEPIMTQNMRCFLQREHKIGIVWEPTPRDLVPNGLDIGDGAHAVDTKLYVTPNIDGIKMQPLH